MVRGVDFSGLADAVDGHGRQSKHVRATARGWQRATAERSGDGGRSGGHGGE